MGCYVKCHYKKLYISHRKSEIATRLPEQLGKRTPKIVWEGY